MVGVIDSELSSLYGATGVVARSCGMNCDIRIVKELTYSYYYYLTFKSFLGSNGDCYDRFIIRIREMLESVYIVYQILPNFFKLESLNFFMNIASLLGVNRSIGLKHQKNTSMESLIEHFKGYSEGIKVNPGSIYTSVEAPKGEFGVTLISDGSSKPFRCKIRTPAYHHLQYMTSQIKGHFFADMITILGSQDIVFGEVDR